jgi:hypothetical protein
MSNAALKRVEAFCDSGWFTKDSSAIWEIREGVRLNVQDLFAVLALAKSADELKRRVRLAEKRITDVSMFAAGLRLSNIEAQIIGEQLDDLLDLRKPLPKARGR